MRSTTRLRFVAVLALVFAITALVGFAADGDAGKKYACPDVDCSAFSGCSAPTVLGECWDGNGDLAYVVCSGFGVECRLTP